MSAAPPCRTCGFGRISYPNREELYCVLAHGVPPQEPADLRRSKPIAFARDLERRVGRG